MTPAKAPKKRTRRDPLDRERIEAAALELIERDGLDELSMRKLGAALGVEAMSLYHHYPSKAHLLDALLDRLIASITVAADRELPFRERARQACLSYREVALRHPKFAQFMIVHRMNTRSGLLWLESIARIFADAGFDTELAARCFRVLGYYLMGAILDETAGYVRGPSATQELDPAEQAAIAPTTASFGPYFGRSHWENTFLLGLDLLLDELERKRECSHASRSTRRTS